MSNWYVIQVMSGKEKKTLDIIKNIINEEYLIDSFIPYIEKTKKYRGEWQLVKEVLFSGYIFLISDNIKDLYQELKKVPRLTKLLGMVDGEVYALSDNEVDFIKTFTNDDYTIDFSVGLIEGDKVKVIKGPLVGKEALIKKIDRHKRIAYLNIDFFNQSLDARVGLEIIKKI